MARDKEKWAFPTVPRQDLFYKQIKSTRFKFMKYSAICAAVARKIAVHPILNSELFGFQLKDHYDKV
jgi:hypothetical protein